MLNKVKEMGSTAVDTTMNTGRTIYLAGLGVAATVEENSRKAFDSLVEKGRGNTAEKSGENTLEKTKNAVSARFKTVSDQLTDRFQSGLNTTLGFVGIPSRQEIRDLTSSVEALTAQVQSIQVKGAL
jgi:poly(hydroxyalkanoate) granule-associated protein